MRVERGREPALLTEVDMDNMVNRIIAAYARVRIFKYLN